MERRGGNPSCAAEKRSCPGPGAPGSGQTERTRPRTSCPIGKPISFTTLQRETRESRGARARKGEEGLENNETPRSSRKFAGLEKIVRTEKTKISKETSSFSLAVCCRSFFHPQPARCTPRSCFAGAAPFCLQCSKPAADPGEAATLSQRRYRVSTKIAER